MNHILAKRFASRFILVSDRELQGNLGTWILLNGPVHIRPFQESVPPQSTITSVLFEDAVQRCLKDREWPPVHVNSSRRLPVQAECRQSFVSLFNAPCVPRRIPLQRIAP